ncbi:unnamed protein product [Caenorhabditis nigoni]
MPADENPEKAAEVQYGSDKVTSTYKWLKAIDRNDVSKHKKSMTAKSNGHESKDRRQDFRTRMWIGYDQRLKGIQNLGLESRRLQ